MRAWGRLTGLVAGVLLIATQASAQGVWPGGPGSTTPLVPGQLFVGVGAQAGVYHLPKFESPWRSSNGAGIFSPATDLLRPSIEPDPTVAGPGGVVGYVFRDGTFPAWAGKKVRLSFGAQYWEGNFTDRQDRPQMSFGLFGIISPAPIDGSPGSQIVNSGWTQRQANFNIDTNGYELALRLTSDYPVAPRFTLSPFVALFGGQSRDSYAFRARLVQNGYDGSPYALDEHVSSARIGAMVGTGVTLRVVPRLSLHLGAQAGFVWIRSHMTGRDCFAGGALFVPGTPCGTLGPGGFQTSVTDSRSTVGFRGGLTGGVTLDLTFAILSLTGFMTYDSAVPGIRNPTVTVPITAGQFGNTAPTSGRAHLFFDDAPNFGGMVVLRIPLNAPGG